MKTKLLSLAFAGICSLPSITNAQVDCVAGPGGSPLCAIAITTNGNVGIGTQPNEKLHVNGNGVFEGGLLVRNGITVSTSFEGIRFQNSAGGILDWFCGAQPDNTFRIFENNIGGPNSRFSIAPGGNIGIGTASPRALLHITGHSPAFTIQGTEGGDSRRILLRGSGPDQGNPNWMIAAQENADQSLEITPSDSRGGDTFRQPLALFSGNRYVRVFGDFLCEGSVGVGTTTPSAKLDVNGKVRCEVLEVTSDRNAKTKFKNLNLPHMLEKLSRMEVSEWEYTNAPGVRHYGAMAQDFHRTFGLGTDDKHINPLDAASVALAGVQALTRELKEKDAQIADLKSRLERMDKQLASNSALMEKLAAQLRTGTNVDSLYSLPFRVSANNSDEISASRPSSR